MVLIYLPVYLTVGMAFVVFFLYKWATQNDEYFVKRGVVSVKPALIFGNSADFFTKKIDLIEFVKKLYDDFPNEK